MRHYTLGLSLPACCALAALLAGCATPQSPEAQRWVRDKTAAAHKSVTEWVTPLFKTGEVRSTDKYCDSVEESYEITDNALRIGAVVGLQTIQRWQQGGYARKGKGDDIEDTVKTVSKRYVWMPVAAEEYLGLYMHQQQKRQDNILPRDSKNKQIRSAYAKADSALKAAAQDYPKLPYQPQLYIVKSDESDQINAEALPAGYVYLTKKAAQELDEDALRLVLGHEMAHIAKRHTSKQIQQRLVDTGLAVDVFKHMLENRSYQDLDKVFGGASVIEKLNGVFAKYDQDQELQADACSVRSMVAAGIDPLKAREEYLRKRGTEKSSQSASGPRRSPFGLGFTEHPDDEERDRFFKEAYNYHRHKKSSNPVSSR